MTFGLFGAILEGAADLTSDTVYHLHRTTNQALDTSGLGGFVPRPIRYAGDQFAGLAQHGIRDVGYTTGGVLRSFDGNVGPAAARHGSSYQCGAEDRFGGGFQGCLGFGTHASFGTAGFNAGAAGYGTQSGAMSSPWGGQAQQPCYQPALPSVDPGPKISGGVGGNGGNGGASGGGGGTGQGVHIREETRFREISGGTGGHGGTGNTGNGGNGGAGEGVWIGGSPSLRSTSPPASDYGTPSERSFRSGYGFEAPAQGQRGPAMSLEAFCARYSLSPAIKQLLEDEGYETAGGLVNCTEQDLASAKLKNGQIGEVKRALKSWMAEHDIH